MKKFWFILMLIGLVFVACEKEKSIPVNEEKAELIVEDLISMDRQDMFMNYAEDYRWYETCIVLKDYLDSENVNDTVVGVTSVFQIVTKEDSSCVDTKVVLISHTVDTSFVKIEHGFWTEDLLLNDELISLTFKEAYQKIMEINFPKPHSKQCVLRKPLGPIDCHPQYIFGNIRSQLYVDAITGGVTDKNPAFYGSKFNSPVNNWP